ncbi:MAG: DNA alkylation repair protein [Rikenellaceae bacterium]
MEERIEDIDILRRRLASRLRVEMNGAVSASMRNAGVDYKLNYGVSIPTIKDVAADYSGNMALALRLYESDVRELRLSAIYIASPEDITEAIIEQWKSGVVNTEVAEQLSLNIISRLSFGFAVGWAWMASSDKYISYAGMMSLGARLRLLKRSGGELTAIELGQLFSIIDLAIEKAKDGGLWWHGALAMLSAVCNFDSMYAEQMKTRYDQLKSSGVQWWKNLALELEWQHEYQ